MTLELARSPGEARKILISGEPSDDAQQEAQHPSYRFSTWQWGAAQAGGRRQVATRQRPQISLEGGSDIAARGCDERIRHHLGLAGNLG
jgi:hypothetical protein